MRSHRALYWAETIGADQFRLRIRDNTPYNHLQWWIFDSRTSTIRANKKRSHAISNQIGQGYNIGKVAVIRPFKGDVYQRIMFFPGSRRNIRNRGEKCLDVWGGTNINKQHITWWSCHNGLNQAWFIDQRTNNLPSPPINDGVKFQIKTKMQGNRALTFSARLGDG